MGESDGRSGHGHHRAPAPPARRRHTCTPWQIALVICATACVAALKYMADLSLPSFSVHLVGYDGTCPGPAAAALSPAFNLTLHMRNTCVDRADVTVLYSGVALGWATVEPRDCAGQRWDKAVEAAARGEGVKLSDRLRERLSSEWNDGTVELDVDVKVFGGKRGGLDSGSDIPTKLILCKVTLDEGQKKPTYPCTWSELRSIAID